MKRHKRAMAVCVLFVLMGIAVLSMRQNAESSSCCPGEGHADAKLENHDGHDHDAGEAASPACPVASHAEEKPENCHGHGDGHGPSDLDRPLEDLWSAKCEHDILHYTCDECRYELGVVKLSATLFSNNGKDGIISSGTPTERRMGKPLYLTGEVVTNDLGSIRVSSIVSGTVGKIMADIGGRVSRGDVLIELDSMEVAEAKADFLKKTAACALATKTAEREAGLFAKKISAEVEVIEARNKQAEAEIELAGARSRLVRMGLSENEIKSLGSASPAAIDGILRIRAAIDGMVLERFVVPGETVDAGQEIMLVSDISEVWINADIKETDFLLLSLRNTDTPCEVNVPGADGITLPGTLAAVSGKMDETTRTIRARVSVKNPDDRLRPGMFVNVDVMPRADNTVLTVPENAVLSDEDRAFVFVHKEGDYWIRRPVETGVSFEGFTEIKSGLSRDQLVIADGSFLLKSDVLREKMGAGCAD